MFLKEITITKLPTDYKSKVNSLKSRTGLTDDDLDELVSQQDLDPAQEEPESEDNDTHYDDSSIEQDSEEPLEPESDSVEPEDLDKAGLIRTVPKARMVYKRSQPDGTFSELWLYAAKNIKDTMVVRNNILSGTDIEPSKLASDDGSQTFKVWAVGDIELLSINGLPN